MHIGLDISQIVYEGTGVARFTYHLTRTILDDPHGHTWTFFFSSLKQELHADIYEMIHSRGQKLCRWYVPPRALSLLWNTPRLRSYAPVPGVYDVFISSDWTQPPARIAPRRATIVHDLICMKLPETVDPLISSTQAKRLALVAKECDIVYCDSQSTATDYREYYPGYKGQVIVNYPGIVAPQPPPDDTFSFPFTQGEYVFAVGKIEPRKNLPRLIDAFTRISRDDAFKHLHLVIVGPRGWDVHTEQMHHPHVHLLGQVDDGTLATLYAHALVFVYPTLYEGFGIPPLEAMSLGCPVIMSRNSSLVEIADDESAIFVDPQDTNSIVDAIRTVALDVTLRNRLVTAGRSRAARFRYQTYLETMLESIDTSSSKQ